MIVTMLGSSGTIPIPHRPLTSVHVLVDSNGILIDCGEGNQTSLASAKVSYSNIEVVCLTHYHPDHILGLPGLISTINTWLKLDEHKNKRNLLIIGPPDKQKVISKLVDSVVHPYVNVLHYEVFNDGCDFDFGNFRIETFFVKHSIACLGYNIVETKNPRVVLEKADSSGVERDYWKFLQKRLIVEVDGKQYDKSVIMVGEQREIKISYVTDTLPIPIISERIKGARLAILEGMHYSRQKCMRNNPHMLFGEAAKIASDGNVQELWLTHFSPTIKRPADGLKYAKKFFKNVSVCENGMRVEFK